MAYESLTLRPEVADDETAPNWLDKQAMPPYSMSRRSGPGSPIKDMRNKDMRNQGIYSASGSRRRNKWVTMTGKRCSPDAIAMTTRAGN
ncbi:MAG: hypothetical protein ABSG76_19045, partial [Xanthobacteraceae bacterium]